MPTNIEIASNALQLIGDEPINSFSDEGAGAQVAGNLYPETYRGVLAEHPWTFALKEQLLNLLSQSPDDLTGFSNAFQLPPDLIRLWAVLSHSNYTIVGSLVYSNENELLARYVYQVEETELPPHFTKALEYKLASEFSISIREDVQMAGFYEKKYLQFVALARSIDSQQKPPVKIVDSPFTDVRRHGHEFWQGG